MGNQQNPQGQSRQAGQPVQPPQGYWPQQPQQQMQPQGQLPSQGQPQPVQYYQNQQGGFVQYPNQSGQPNYVNPQAYYQPQYRAVAPQSNINSARHAMNQELESVVPPARSRWFGSIQYRPQRMKFATQDQDEKIYVLVRMHWIRNLGWILNSIFYSTIPFIVVFILQVLNIQLEFLSFRVFVLILLAYYSVLFTNVIRQFYDWYYDVYIVTNHRIIDYAFSPFKGYTVTEAPLESIEDVEERSLGFLADMFNYGTIKARTASNAGELSFDYIADPTRVRDVIMDLAKIVKRYSDGQ